jgi:hypothetical protein
VAALGQWGRGTVDVGQWTALSRWGKWGESWIAEIWEMVYHPLFHLHLQPILFFLFFFKKKDKYIFINSKKQPTVVWAGLKRPTN